MENAVLALEAVSCRFESHRRIVSALSEVSLTIVAGERVALVGPSGAGKSTLIGVLNGSLKPTAGQVLVLGQRLHYLHGRHRRRLQRQVGTVYQQHNLIGNLAVVHNVNAGHLGRWPLWKALLSLVIPQQTQAAKKALSQLGIADLLYARTDRLSGGQQQRVALARVLVQNPAIVLADEPVASVDPARAEDILERLCEVGENRTLLVSLHDVDLARAYCDRIIGLRAGRLMFDLPSEAVGHKHLASLYDLDGSSVY